MGEALGKLTQTFTELHKHLYTDEGKIRSFVNVYVNDTDIRFLDKENTPIKDGDTISIVPSIAGGAPTDTQEVKLSKEEIQRYSRHLIMPEVGLDGQLKLKRAKVLMIGAGGFLVRRWACIWPRQAWAIWESWISMWWIRPTYRGRSRFPPPTWASSRVKPRKSAWPASTRRSRSRRSTRA